MQSERRAGDPAGIRGSRSIRHAAVWLLSLAALLAPLLLPAPAQAAGAKALDEYFSGKVVELDGDVVTLRYDFRKEAQVKDFLDRIPYRIQKRKGQGLRWFDERLEIIGNAGARHKAEWIGDILITATFIPDMKQDFGGYLSPVTETEDFATFTFVETFFHAFDNSAGGSNSIIKFGAQFKESGASMEYTGFRYVDRKSPKVKPSPGQSMRASFGLKRRKLVFNPPEQELKGSDRGKRLKHFHVGFYAIKGRLLLDNIEIQGKLAKDWMKREQVELRTARPIGAAASGEVDDATRELMAKHAKGSRRATSALMDIVKDESRPANVREAVVEALSGGPKKAVPRLLDLLYHADEQVREYGIRIVSALLGKDYGYKAGASEKKRESALRALNKDLKNNPGLLKD